MRVRLQDIQRCLHGIIPSAIGTADAQGMPNVTYVSHVELVDDKHVALSCQFFNKTRQNVEANPYASLYVSDPIEFSAYRLALRYRQSQTTGALYERMRTRIDALAAHCGMTGVFQLLSADIYEVESVLSIDGFLEPLPESFVPPAPELSGPLNELHGLQTISHCINTASHLGELVDAVLSGLEQGLGFEHSMLLMFDEAAGRLDTIASHGYGAAGIGAEVQLGEGLIGKAAQERRVVRTVGMVAELSYGRAIRERAEALGHGKLSAAIPLPGLPDAQSQMALPLCVRDRLIGVLAVESVHPLRFEQWHETFLELIGNQLALAIDRFASSDDRDSDTAVEEDAPPSTHVPDAPDAQSLQFYPADDSVFIGDEYLVRGLAGRILWKLLSEALETGRREFTNRQLRLDESLGLPAIKDNLESRLLLLRRRLEEKTETLRIVPSGRGRFEVHILGAIRLIR